MPDSRRSRLAALLATVAIIAATFVPATPALAEEPPAPDPVVTSEPTPEPTGEPTPEATSEPTPEPTPEVTSESTPQPTPTETVVPTPEPSAAPDPESSVQYAGTFAAIGDSDESSTRLFQVNGFGILAVDVTGFAPTSLLGTRVATLELPAGVVLGGDQTARFGKLATASVKKPLTLLATRVGLTLGKQTASLVNQGPVTPATHRIYAVLVTPSSGAQAGNQTSTKVSTAVTYLDDYWNQQSSGSVRFTLAGTTNWYKSTHSCMSDAGSTALWNQAASVAKTQLGYVAGKNNHLVLFFPSSQDCGGSIGLGTIGDGVNNGGVSWVIGTDAPTEMATLAHEIGHNLSLGHADWMECDGVPANTNPNPGFLGTAGCTKHEYGDAVDVMGFGNPNLTAGALSSPLAIRSGIWPASAWQTAPVGTTSYTLNTVASNTGPRAVVVQDDGGVNYFVEFRTFDGEDAQYNGYGCDSSACVASASGVRIMRLENNAYKFTAGVPNGFQGFPGDESYLIGHRVLGVNKVNFVQGEVYWTKGLNNGIKITVTNVTETTATVQIIKASDTANADSTFYVSPTDSYDAKMRVGDTWSAMAGATYDAQTTTFQWYRGSSPTLVNTPIPGATSQNYTLQWADVGRFIRVTMSGISGASSTFNSDPSGTLGYGPIVTGIYLVDQPGSVAIDNTTTPLAAVDSGWPLDHGAFSYQWFRGSSATTATTAIVGATASTYTPTSADTGKFLRVRIKSTIPGYSTVSRYSPAKNYSILGTGTASLAGSSLTVGQLMTAGTSSFTFSTVDGPLAAGTTTFRWYRNGVLIPTDTSQNHTVDPLDYGAKITVRLVRTSPGWVTYVSPLSAPVTPNVKGTIYGSHDPATMTKVVNGSTFTLTATLPVGSIIEPGVAYAYQWYRVNRTTSAVTAITGATKAAYTPVAADYPYKLKVRVTVTKRNYNTVTLYSTPMDYSLRVAAATPLVYGGQATVFGNTITPAPLSFEYMLDNGAIATTTSPGLTLTAFTWYRSGIKIPSTVESHTLDLADVGKVMSFRLDARLDGYLPIVHQVSANTPKVTLNLFDPMVTPNVSQNTMTLSVTTALTDVVSQTTSGVYATSIRYQWYRGATAIPGATQFAYSLSQADAGQPITVRVSYARVGYETKTVTATSVGGGTGIYSVVPTTAPVLSGSPKAAGVLTASTGVYKDGNTGAAITPDVSYTWYRNGVRLTTPDALDGDYHPLAGDSGAVFSVKVNAGSPGLVSAITTLTTQTLGASAFPNWDAPASVTQNGLVLTAVPGPDLTGLTGVTNTYQWYRGGTAIPRQTKITYTLTAADYNQLISVRVTTKKPGYTTTVTFSPKTGYSVLLATLNPVYTLFPQGGAPGDPMKVGTTIVTTRPSGAAGTFVDATGASLPVTGANLHYTWYRNGVRIADAADSQTYVLRAADLGKTMSVKMTASLPGLLSWNYTSKTAQATQKVVAGTLVGTGVAPTVTVGSPLVAVPPPVTGTVLAGSQPAKLSYQWLRNGAIIKGATKSTFVISSADRGKTIQVRVVASLSGYTSVVLPLSTAIDYSIKPHNTDPPRVWGGGWTVGTGIGLADVNFMTAAGVVLTPDTIKVEWLRTIGGKTTVAATGTDQNYTLVAADYGARMSARLTAAKAGYVTLVFTTPVVSYVVAKGVDDSGAATVSVQEGPALGVLTAVVTGVTPAIPVPAFAYTWYRDDPSDANPPAVIAGATAKTYKLVAADYDKEIKVRVTMTRPNFVTPLPNPVMTSAAAKHSIYSDPLPPGLAGIPQVGQLLTATPPPFWSNVDKTTQLDLPGLVSVYTWYRNGVAISGATQSTYMLTAADKGTKIKVKVTANYPGLLALSSEISPETAPVVAGVFTGSFIPQVVGNSTTKKKTVTVTATTITAPSGFSTSYVWKRGTSVVTGATSSTFTLAATDSTKDVTVTITLKKTGYTTKVITVHVNAITSAAPVTIVGTPMVGVPLSADAPIYYYWNDNGPDQVAPGTLVYQWKVDGTAVAGDPGHPEQYTPQLADSGKTLTVVVTAAAPYHYTRVDTSATGVVLP